MTKLNRLPDLCILAIFTRVPMSEQIMIGLVCQRWKYLQPVVTKKITSLTISIGFDSFRGIRTRFIHPYTDLLKNDDQNRTSNDLKYHSKMYTHMNSLIFDGDFSLSLTQQITNTFPNVTSLEVSFAKMSNESVESVVHLLNHYHSQLISIKLFCEYDEPNRNWDKRFDCSPLLSSINRMPSPLRFLLIELNNYTTIKRTTLPIISQLEQFYFYNSHFDYDQYYEMKKYIMQNTNLRQIGLDYWAWLELEKCQNRVTRLIHCRAPRYLDLYSLEQLCRKFPPFPNVALICEIFEFNAIFWPLAKLQNLTYLQLNLTFEATYYPEPLLRKIQNNFAVQAHLQLTTVKTIEFKLDINMALASDFADLNISCRFPSVQVIKLIFDKEKPNEDEKHKVYNHLKSMCSQLHHLFVDSVAIWYRADDCLKDCANMYNHRMIEL